MIMPKPDLMPLTGGYRKTPVLQIGADIYCDTRLIARELERRFPSPTLFPGGNRGLSLALTHWSGHRLLRARRGPFDGADGTKSPKRSSPIASSSSIS